MKWEWHGRERGCRVSCRVFSFLFGSPQIVGQCLGNPFLYEHYSPFGNSLQVKGHGKTLIVEWVVYDLQLFVKDLLVEFVDETRSTLLVNLSTESKVGHVSEDLNGSQLFENYWVNSRLYILRILGEFCFDFCPLCHSDMVDFAYVTR